MQPLKTQFCGIVTEFLDNLFGIFWVHDIARRNDLALVNPHMLTHSGFFKLIFCSFFARNFSKRHVQSAQRSRFYWPTAILVTLGRDRRLWEELSSFS